MARGRDCTALGEVLELVAKHGIDVIAQTFTNFLNLAMTAECEKFLGPARMSGPPSGAPRQQLQCLGLGWMRPAPQNLNQSLRES